MAKEISVEDFNKQKTRLESNISELESELEATPGYYGDDTSTTNPAISKEIELRQNKRMLDRLKSNMQAQRYYGGEGEDSAVEVKQPREGWFMKSLSAIQTPLYGSIGLLRKMLGKTDDGVFEAMDRATKERATYGTLFKEVGVTPSVAAPLGFAADMILDPVNMLTLGSSGFLGKMAKGAYKGGLPGLASGAKSAYYEGLRNVLKFTPEFIGRAKKSQIIELLDEAVEKGVKLDDPSLIKNIRSVMNPEKSWKGRFQAAYQTRKIGVAKKAFDATDEWRKAIGSKGVIDDIVNLSASRYSVTNGLRYGLEQSEIGKKILGKVDLDYESWNKTALFQNDLYNQIKGGTLNLQNADDYEKAVEAVQRYFRSGGKTDVMREIYHPDASSADKLKAAEKIIGDEVQEVTEMATTNPKTLRGESTHVNATRMLEEAENEEFYNEVMDEVGKAIKERAGNVYDTGFDTADKYLNKARDFTIKFNKKDVAIGKKILDGYANFISIFKSFKLGPLSPASYVYSVLGNITMTHMAGIDVTNPLLHKTVAKSLSYLLGKSDDIGDVLTSNPNLARFLEDYDLFFSKVFGFSRDEAIGRQTLSYAIEQAIKDGVLAPGSVEAQKFRAELVKMFGEDVKKMNVDEALTKYWGSAQAREARRISRPSERVGDITKPGISKERAAAEEAMGGSVTMTAAELTQKPFLDFKDKLKAKAESGNLAAKYLLKGIELSKWYEVTDQASRLGLFIHMTTNGLGENELRKLVGWKGFSLGAGGTKFSMEDFTGKVIRGLETKYTISPLKATEICNEIFMNYAAMPAIVKLLRQMPILSHPFFAFSYAMALKTGKTFVVNPAAFNKVSFLMQEFERDKTPLEKKALQSKYYSWYNQKGMWGFPGKIFEENPVYLNLQNAIPYYSMNMFMPSERKFEEGWRGVFADTIDSMPLLKDPVGQVITDYFILPLILKETEAPRNMFGGVLYPKDAPAWQKYAALPSRQLAESVLPSLAALPFGLASMFAPEKAIEFIPSYHGRKISYAIRGKTPVGVESKESRTARTARAIASLVGINVYPINLKNMESSLKKALKKSRK